MDRQCDHLGVVTFNSTGHREHSFDGAFPQFFGWLPQSGQVFGGELYQGSGARKFSWLSVGVEILPDHLLHSAADRSAGLPVYGRDPFLALRHFIELLSTTNLISRPVNAYVEVCRPPGDAPQKYRGSVAPIMGGLKSTLLVSILFDPAAFNPPLEFHSDPAHSD